MFQHQHTCYGIITKSVFWTILDNHNHLVVLIGDLVLPWMVVGLMTNEDSDLLMWATSLYCAMLPGVRAQVDIPCNYLSMRPFVRLKSRGSRELTNISTSISIQRICLDLQLMEIFVKCLCVTFAHGILSLSNLRSTPFPTVTALVQCCCLTPVQPSHREI
ncbi:hypothetical protein PILCRDRAFT_454718 [Piloderma croceum F 1598]|uniref:Uncharacterized protein n=1 Tax=Piloderma croceum (strain F 1598) TaxID=765440 RepID=A0A0C3FW07_PILCF|nr:hypothetical protein PILCRDRAFT_454718 [Piloderma croceum F 1598]